MWREKKKKANLRSPKTSLSLSSRRHDHQKRSYVPFGPCDGRHDEIADVCQLHVRRRRRRKNRKEKKEVVVAIDSGGQGEVRS